MTRPSAAALLETPGALTSLSVTVESMLAAARAERLPRLALIPEEAAAAIGVSRDFFDEHVLPELRVVRRGRKRLIPTRELERWVEQNAERAL